MNNTLNNTLITQVDELNKKVSLIKEQSESNIFSVKNIAKTLMPTIKKIIDSLNNSRTKSMRGRANQSVRSPNDSSFVKEKYINDLINEFEEDRSRSGSRRSSVSASLITANLNKNNQTDNLNSDNKSGNKTINNDLTNISNKKAALNNSNNSTINVVKNANSIAASKAAEVKPKRTIREMFSKAFNFSTGKKDISQSRLAKLLQDADEDQTKHPVSDNNASNNNYNKNNSSNINDIMTKIDNDKMNTSEISIKNAKLNNSSFIDLNDEDYETHKHKFDLKDAMKNVMKKFVFNVIADGSNNDKYEFKTFYIKAENSNNKNNSTNSNDKNINNDLNGAGSAAVYSNKEQKAKNTSKNYLILIMI